MTRHAVNTTSLEDLLAYGPVMTDRVMSITEFTALYRQFPALQMEREADGKVKIMSPVKKGSGRRELLLSVLIGNWVLETGLGEAYSPSVGIQLPDGAIKGPDFAWISDEKLLEDGSDEEFIKVVPDFVAEVRSSSDRVPALQNKMKNTWMANGVRLGWLIDPYGEQAWVYQQGQETVRVEGFDGQWLDGGEVMPGLRFPLDRMKAKK